MDNLKVSVILPTFNRNYIVSRAIDSVLKQDFFNWELIIVDDGSTDDTRNKVASYRDERIKYFVIPHKGQSAARNFGIKNSSGELIAFLDSDDYYLPHHLSRAVKYFAENSACDFWRGRVQVLGERLVRDMENLEDFIDVEECHPQGTFVFRRSILAKIGLLPEVDYGEDYLFYNRAKENGLLVFDDIERTYIFDRTGENSVTKSFARQFKNN